MSSRPEQVAGDFHDAQARLASLTAQAAGRHWDKVDPADIMSSWADQLPAVTSIVTGGQTLAADAADVYLAELADVGGFEAGSAIEADSFAGIASDGRGLVSLLNQPAITVLTSLSQGAPLDRAMAGGGAALDMIARTQVADAGRSATAVGLAANKRFDGYVRIVQAKACSRCIILAGRFYAWSSGFKRHPNCSCVHMPCTRDEGKAFGRLHNPRSVYDSLGPLERQRAGWSVADQQAIHEGADLTMVTNIRGVATSGATRYAGKLTPDQIFARANGDRDEALRLLRRNGYLRGERTVARRAVEPPPPAVKAPEVQPFAWPKGDFANWDSVVATPLAEVEAAAKASEVLSVGTRRYDLRGLGGKADQLPTEIRQLGGGQMAHTNLLTFADGTRVIEKVYDRIGETAAELKREIDSEVLGAQVLKAVTGRSATTVALSRDRLVMEYVDGVVGAEMELTAALLESAQGQRLGLADVVMGNLDRNSGNWLLTPAGDLVGIDHGVAFYPTSQQWAFDEFAHNWVENPSITSFSPQLKDRLPITRQEMADVKARIMELRPAFVERRRGTWFNEMMSRIRQIEKKLT